jgi:hypothetical protein
MDFILNPEPVDFRTEPVDLFGRCAVVSGAIMALEFARDPS